MALRRVANPPNPFESTHREWLGEIPPARVEVFEETARSILSTNDSPDIPFTYSVNPYRGCQHACSYCYARPTHEYLGYGAGTDFDTKLIVKTNAPELLDRELRKIRGESIAFSGVTDAYQPLESVYRLTRGCLEACLRHRCRASIVTKSFLISRDAELLAELNAAAGLRVYFSIPFMDAEVARLVERGAPPPQKRFEAMKRLHDAGVPVNLLIAPIIPGLNDRDVARLLSTASECGARSAGYLALRLPGSVQEVFLSRLRDDLPDRAARVEHHIRAMRGGHLSESRFGCRMRGEGEYWAGVERLFKTTARRCGIELTDRPTEERIAEKCPDPGPRATLQLPLFGQFG